MSERREAAPRQLPADGDARRTTGANQGAPSERREAAPRQLPADGHARRTTGAKQVAPSTSLTLKIGPGDTAPDEDARASYDQVIATVPVRDVPYRWVQLVRPGGELVVSWNNPFAGPVVARLSVAADGRAAGRFVEVAELADDDEGAAPVVVQAQSAVPWYRTTTRLDPDEVWADPGALFALGVRLSRVRWTQTGSDQVRRWVYDASSCACAMTLPSGEIQVEQHGPRLLWREVESAYQWWHGHERPAFDNFGMTVTSFGQFAWLGDRCSGRIWRL
jgi:hypothetical protein